MTSAPLAAVLLLWSALGMSGGAVESPGTLEDHAALSERYLVAGEDGAAERLWRDFTERNLADRGRLMAGARVMSEMGLDALAIEGIERHQRAYGIDLALLGFLFELHRERGNAAEAERILQRMDAVLPSAAGERAGLADNYSRLNLPARALEVLSALERAAGGLDYAGYLQVAALQTLAGQSGAALQTWRKVWRQASSPARREFIQERLMSVAQEQGRLGELTEEIKASLAAGGDLAEARLLVSTQSKAGDTAAAIDTIDRFFAGFGLGAIDVLKEHARVYRAAGLLTEFAAVQRRLMEADPGNAGEYMRALVLQTVEQPGADRQARLEELLAEWRAMDAARIDSGFEAGVLMRANLLDRAIEVYKQALAADPADRDSYLLLAEALKKRNRQPEAIALLRALAGTARDDELFLTAIDGLLNTVSGFPGNPPEPAALEQLRWARDKVTERLNAGGKALWLYQLLMDINEALQDAAGYLAAAESSLAMPGAQRGAILRQLLAVTAPQERPMPPMGLRIDDVQLHLSYGRRLMELGAGLPPDVYLDLGKAFLDNADPQGAARAFELAIGGTGRADLMRQAAKLFDSRGYPQEALQMLTRARIRARNDIAIAWQLARLNERAGQRERAHALYAQTLRTLMLKQPATPGQPLRVDPYGGNRTPNPLDGKPVTREFHDHYEPLVKGYLSTWPAEGAAAREEMESLERLLEEAMTSAVPGEWLPYSRVDLMARLLRRVAFAMHDPALTARVDGRLLERFGSGAVEAPAAVAFPAVQAANAAWLEGDPERLLAALREWARSGSYRHALNWADGKLEARRYRVFAREVLALTRGDAEFMRRPLLDTSGANARFLLRLEAASGEEVFSARELLAMLMAFDTLTEIERASIAATPYLMGKLSAQELAEWFRYAAEPARRPMTYSLALQFWSRLLAAPPPDSRTAEALRQRMDEILTDNKPLAGPGADFASAQLLVTAIDRGNVAAARAVTNAWRKRLNHGVDPYEPAYLLAEGRVNEAVDAFLALPPPSGNGGGANLHRKLQELFLPRYAAEIRQRGGSSRESIERQLQLADSGPAAQARILPLLEAAVAAFPQDTAYLARLATAYSSGGRLRDAAAVLEKLHQLDPDSLDYRVSLYQAWVRNDNVLGAFQLQRATTQDLRNPPLAAGLQRPGMRQGAPPIGPGGMPRMSGGMSRLNDRLARLAAAMTAGKSDEVKAGLRTVWHMAEEDESIGIDRLFAMSLPGAMNRKLLDAVSEQPAAVEVLEDFHRSLDARERQQLYPLAVFLARAYLNTGLATGKAESLERMIVEGGATASDLTVWLSVLAGQESAPSAASAGVLRTLAREPQRLSQQQLLPLARAFVKMGDQEQAAALYRLLACDMLVAGVHPPPVSGKVGYEGLLTATQFVEEVTRMLDAPHRLALERDVVKLVAPPADSGPTLWQRYREFVVQVAVASNQPQQAWTAYRERIGAPGADRPAEMLAALTMLQARAGDFAAATKTLEWLATRETAASMSFFPMQMAEGGDFATNAEYTGMLGLSTRPPAAPGDTAVLARVFSGAGPKWADAAAAKLDRLPGRDGVDQDALFAVLAAADAAGVPLGAETRGALMTSGRVEPQKLAALVQRIADAGDPERALKLGGEATGYTQNDALLAVLEKLASDTGRAEEAQRWQTMRAAAREAREALNAR